MISKEYKLQLIVKSLNELGYPEIANQLTTASTTTTQPKLAQWFYNSLATKDYNALDTYLTDLIEGKQDPSEFVQLLNIPATDDSKSLLNLLLYFIRRINYLEIIQSAAQNSSVDEKLNYISGRMMPLLDQIDNVLQFDAVFDVNILQNLSREQESTLLLNESLPFKDYLLLDRFEDLPSFTDSLFKNVFKNEPFEDIPDLTTILQQASKYEQLQSPYYLPPRTKQERKKLSASSLVPPPSKKYQKNFNPGKLLHTLTFHNDEVWFIKFSPSGRFMVTGSSDGRLVLYDVVNNFSLIKILEPTLAADNSAFVSFSSKPPSSANKNKAVIYCCWDPKENYIVSCCLDTVVRVWSVGELHKKRITRSSSTESSLGDFKLISCFTLAPDIKTWTCEFLPENKKITTESIHSDTPQFIVGSPDKVLKIFDCNGVELFDFYANIEEDDDDDDENDDDEDHPRGEDLKRDDVSMKDVEDLPSADKPKSSSSNTTSTNNNNTNNNLESNFNRINDLAITNDGNLLITLNDHQVHFYTIPEILNDESTTRRISNIQFKGRLTSCSISNNGNYLLINSAPEELQVWDISPLETLHKPILYKKFFGHSQSSFIVRSTFGYLNEDTASEDDGEEELILTGSDEGYIYFWKLHTGQLITRIKGHVGLCNGVDWNKKGSVVKGKDLGKVWGSVGDDKLVKIWTA